MSSNLTRGMTIFFKLPTHLSSAIVTNLLVISQTNPDATDILSDVETTIYSLTSMPDNVKSILSRVRWVN
jgi:hypothetical protein